MFLLASLLLLFVVTRGVINLCMTRPGRGEGNNINNADDDKTVSMAEEEQQEQERQNLPSPLHFDEEEGISVEETTVVVSLPGGLDREQPSSDSPV